MKSPAFSWLAGLALLAAACFAVAQLFALRYSAGDVYPPGSSRRSDPLGSKALYEAFSSLPGVEAQRNHRPLYDWKPPPGSRGTLLCLGLAHQPDLSQVLAGEPFTQWTTARWTALEETIAGGARAVFAYAPVLARPPSIRAGKAKDPRAREAGEEPPNAEELERLREARDPRHYPFGATARRWGFSLGIPDPKDETSRRLPGFPAKLAPGAPPLEPEVFWPSRLYFQDLAPEWRVLYTSRGLPVLIERPWGSGTLVLAADSFFLSNEALRSHRAIGLLGWLAGDVRTLTFDEWHFGISEGDSIAALTRRYGLGGVVGAIALVGALALWRHAARFVPLEAPEPGAPGAVRGRDAAEGFINLLRRRIHPSALWELCLAEWRKTASTRDQRRADVALARVDRRDVAAAWRAIVEALATKK